MRLFSLLAVLGFFVVACAKDPVFTPGVGGSSGSGGTVGSGGKSGSGGTTASGGTRGSGGTKGSGGTTQPASVDCPDVSNDSLFIPDQYGGTYISLTNNSNKQYYMQANWWGSPYGSQSENVQGLGFTINSPNGTSSSGNNPLGFPSIFIGTYGSKNPRGSNLPKQLSALTSVPTIFETNADQKGTSNYNAAYDVWLTSGSGVVSGSSPGSGGAYLMVWLFMPSDRYPRGTNSVSGRIISGVPGVWNVWVDNSNPSCVSYVSNSTLASLQFDLNLFLQDAVTNKYGNINSNQYLSIIFAGFEVWGGGDGLQVKRFCANVK